MQTRSIGTYFTLLKVIATARTIATVGAARRFGVSGTRCFCTMRQKQLAHPRTLIKWGTREVVGICPFFGDPMSSLRPPKRAGRQAKASGEASSKMTLVPEPRANRDLRQWKIGVGNKVPCFVQTPMY
jgi:hypothetical protein